jgi:hypothetical protein
MTHTNLHVSQVSASIQEISSGARQQGGGLELPLFAGVCFGPIHGWRACHHHVSLSYTAVSLATLGCALAMYAETWLRTRGAARLTLTRYPSFLQKIWSSRFPDAEHPVCLAVIFPVFPLPPSPPSARSPCCHHICPGPPACPPVDLAQLSQGLSSTRRSCPFSV